MTQLDSILKNSPSHIRKLIDKDEPYDYNVSDLFSLKPMKYFYLTVIGASSV